MANIGRGRSFISSEIRKNFSSFYIFGDLSTTKKDLVGKNDLTYMAGSPSLYYGKNGIGEKFDGSKYLRNTSIAQTVSNVPVFIYARFHIDDQASGDLRIASFGSTSSPAYQIDMLRPTGTGSKVYGTVTHSDLTPPNDVSYTFISKSDADYNCSCVFSLRSDALGTLRLFANGLMRTVDVYRAINIGSGSSLNAVTLGAGPSGANGFVGGISYFGWGTGAPDEDFFRRLSYDPDSVILQKSYRPVKASLPSNKQRRTFSPQGARMGSRQAT